MHRQLLVVVAIGIAGATMAAPAASGSGGTGPGVMQGGNGVEQEGLRYVAVPAGGMTTVEAIRRSDGSVLRYSSLKGSWGIPIVAFDGTTDGLMRYGHTLVLGEANVRPNLRKHSLFAFVDMKRMKLIRTIRLTGDFSFDAVAPNGKYLYLIQHVSGQNLTRYRVRAYDLRAERLLPGLVVEKGEAETAMQGWPATRVTSTDRGWVYTLYSGAGKSFIHALDTRNVQAVCVDLPWRSQPARIWDYRLRLDGDGHIVVRGPHGRSLVVVDQANLRLLSSVRNP